MLLKCGGGVHPQRVSLGACLQPLGPGLGKNISGAPSPVLIFFPLCPQLVSEKVGGAEGTKLDDDFKEMEKVWGQGKGGFS